MVEALIKDYFALGFERHIHLFTEFLPKGYAKTTLNSVGNSYYKDLIQIKILLGIFITLYDDFADNPKYQNPHLLTELMKIPEQDTGEINRHKLSKFDRKVLILAESIFFQIHSFLQTLPNAKRLNSLLLFDLHQFYNGLKYSILVRKIPNIANSMECICYLPHNMGIIMVGMMDLMASIDLIQNEIGTIREFFWYAQRFGNICNTLTTLDRELEQHDFGNEIVLLAKTALHTTGQDSKYALIKNQLVLEQENIIERLRQFEIRTFSTSEYIKGLMFLQKLHQQMKEVI